MSTRLNNTEHLPEKDLFIFGNFTSEFFFFSTNLKGYGSLVWRPGNLEYDEMIEGCFARVWERCVNDMLFQNRQNSRLQAKVLAGQ